MCHSVEMYMPGMTERLAERRVGEEAFAAAERERRAAAGLGTLVLSLKAWIDRVRGSRDVIRERLTDV